jgi:hypothetical protein
MSLLTDELSNFYGTNENAWKNVQWHFAERASYLLTRAMVKDTMYAARNFDMPSENQSAVLLTSKRIALAHAEMISMQDMFSSVQRAKEIKLLKKRKEEREKRLSIIENKQLKRDKLLGEIVMNARGSKFYAKDGLGRKVTESLIIYYEGEEEFQVTTHIVNADGTEEDKDMYTTKIVAIADLSPRISLQSGKNLIMTTVQGRDFSRKELVSGGDLNFSVSGLIVSPILDDYPTNDVRKFINIMEYGGIVQVNNRFFDQFNVDRILIKDWRLDAQECKNIQPYSFTCVAVEPDTDVVIDADTIDLINYQIGESGVDGVVSVMLNKKWANRAAGFDFSLADLLGQII